MLDALKRLKDGILLWHYTNNIGKTIEYDDRVVCFIDGSKIKKDCIYCPSIEIQNLVNKPVYFVFNGIDTTSSIFKIIGSGNSNIQISNCTFSGYLSIETSGECMLDSSRIVFLNMVSIKARNISVSSFSTYGNNYGSEIKLCAENCLFVTSSNLGKLDTEFNLKAKDLVSVKETVINGSTFNCETEIFDVDSLSVLNVSNVSIKAKQY